MGAKHAATAEEPSGTETLVARNEAVIVGRLVTEPEQRILQSGNRSGNTVLSFALTVREPGQKTTSVPLVWYQPPARVNRWQIDDIVVARGAVVRRFFRGASGFGSSTEVVVVEAELVRHRAKSRRLVSRAVDRVGGLIDRQTDP